MENIYVNSNIKKLNFFISYPHKNLKYKQKFLSSLKALENTYNIEAWHDGVIPAGGNIDDNVKKALMHSHIVLLLITNDFLSSYYCMQIELETAIKREKAEECIVIPVMFQESVLTDNLAFIKNNRVPQDGKAIATDFKNQNQGCTRAVNMIKDLIDVTFPNCKKSKTATSTALNAKSFQKLTPTKPKKIDHASNISKKIIPYMKL